MHKRQMKRSICHSGSLVGMPRKLIAECCKGKPLRLGTINVFILVFYIKKKIIVVHLQLSQFPLHYSPLLYLPSPPSFNPLFSLEVAYCLDISPSNFKAVYCIDIIFGTLSNVKMTVYVSFTYYFIQQTFILRTYCMQILP